MNHQPRRALVIACLLVAGAAGCAGTTTSSGAPVTATSAAPSATSAAPTGAATSAPAAPSTSAESSKPATTAPAAASGTALPPCTWFTAEQVKATFGENAPAVTPSMLMEDSLPDGSNSKVCRLGKVGDLISAYIDKYPDEGAAKKTFSDTGSSKCRPIAVAGATEAQYCSSMNNLFQSLDVRYGSVLKGVFWNKNTPNELSAQLLTMYGLVSFPA